MLDVARSNIAERMAGHLYKRLGGPPQPDDDLLAAIKAVIADMPTYGYRRVHAILCRKARVAGEPLPNHKRVRPA
ncbi:MAG: IS3 family transposase [Methylobacterium mesophilicum]|nr:IS3 family transposase [Methylobacterium mesophilicum]